MLVAPAAWMLVVTFVLWLVCEVWWATSTAGTSRHDALALLWAGLMFSAVAAAVIAARSGHRSRTTPWHSIRATARSAVR